MRDTPCSVGFPVAGSVEHGEGGFPAVINPTVGVQDRIYNPSIMVRQRLFACLDGLHWPRGGNRRSDHCQQGPVDRESLGSTCREQTADPPSGRLNGVEGQPLHE